MNSARYLIALDVGTTFIKGALFQTIENGQQSLVASVVTPSMILEQTLASIINQLADIIYKQSPGDSYDLVLVGHPPDAKTFTTASNVTRISHEDALSAVVKRLSSTGMVVAIDIGSRRSMVALGKYGKTTVESFEYGVGVESWNFLRRGLQTAQMRSWLPFDMSEEDIENYVANKSVYAHVVPLSVSEVGLEQALTKLILRQISTDLTFPWLDIDQVILSGSVLAQPHIASQSIAMFLDGMQPLSSVQVLTDSTATMYACGGAFDRWSSQDYHVGQVILHNTLTSLGTVMSLAPVSNEPKQKVTKIKLDTGLSTNQAIEVRAGEIMSIPIPAEDDAEVSVKSSNKLNLGGKQSPIQKIVGGEVGLVVDARARPITLPSQERERRAQLFTWEKQLNIHQQVGTIGVTT